MYIPLQNEKKEKTVLQKESTEIAAKADKAEEEVQKTFMLKRDLEETVMDREIKNVLEGELFLTERKVSMFAEDNPKEEEEEDAKVLFEQVEQLLEHASWQNLIQDCIQN